MFIVTLFLLPLPISMQRLVSTLPQPLTPITNVSFLHGTVNLAISIVCYHHIYFNVSVLFCPNCLFKLCSLSYSQRVFNLLFLFLSLLLFVFTLLISISLSLHWPRFLPLPCSSDWSLLHVISFAFIFTLSLCIIYSPSLLSTVFNALNIWPFYTIMIHRLTLSLRFVIAFFLLTVLSVCSHHCCYCALSILPRCLQFLFILYL